MKQEIRDKDGRMIIPFDLEDTVYFMYDNKLNCGTISEIRIISAGDEHHAKIVYKVKIIDTGVITFDSSQCYEHPYDVLASLLSNYNDCTYNNMIELLQSEANADLKTINELNELKAEEHETVD